VKLKARPTPAVSEQKRPAKTVVETQGIAEGEKKNPHRKPCAQSPKSLGPKGTASDKLREKKRARKRSGAKKSTRQEKKGEKPSITALKAVAGGKHSHRPQRAAKATHVATSRNGNAWCEPAGKTEVREKLLTTSGGPPSLEKHKE